MIEPENIEAIRDSIPSVISLICEIANNSNPVPYTVENLEWTKFNVFISALAILIGALGSYYGYKGYYFSKLTAKNVARLPQSTQMKLCMSLLLDLMTNFVRAINIKIYCGNNKKSPSDNYISIFTLPDFAEIFKPEIFYDNEKAFILLCQVKARMNQYNHLIEIIEGHCAIGDITETDQRVLISKTVKVVRAVFLFMKEAYKNDNPVLLKLHQEIANITEKRKDMIEADEKSKILFKSIYDVMKTDYKNTNLDLSNFRYSDGLREKLIAYTDEDTKTEDILLLLAYNGLLEYQYIS